MFQHPKYRGARRRSGRARNGKLVWKNNEGELPQSGKGNTLSGTRRVPKKLGPTRNTPRHIIIKLSKIKEERILKAARGESYLQRSAYRMSKYQLISQKKP